MFYNEVSLKFPYSYYMWSFFISPTNIIIISIITIMIASTFYIKNMLNVFETLKVHTKKRISYYKLVLCLNKLINITIT